MLNKLLEHIFCELNLKSFESSVNMKHACCIKNNKELIYSCNSNDRSMYSTIYKNPIYGIHAEINCLYNFLKIHKLCNKDINFIRKKLK